MEKLGREVLFLRGKPGENDRNSTGAFCRLPDGSILFVWNEYYGTGWEDNHPCNIVCLTSRDEGETWGEKRILMKHDPASMNISVISLCNLYSGELGMIYSFRRKTVVNGNPFGSIVYYFVRSRDEGRSWSQPVNCMPVRVDNYYAGVDSLIRLKSGRLMYSTGRQTLFDEDRSFGPGVVCFFCSDDDGETWHKLPAEIGDTVKGDDCGWQEPRLYELPDGTLWCYARSGLGWQFNAFSHDGGQTWSPMVPNFDFSAPPSPMVIKKAGPYTVSVFNPVPRHVDSPAKRLFGRTPIIFGAAPADQVKVEKYYALEDDLNNAYCYPLVCEGTDSFLVAYEHSADTSDCHTAIKMVKIRYDEIRLDAQI